MKKSYKKQLFNITFVLFLAGLTLLMLWLSSDELNMDAVWGFFENCNVWLFVAAFGCMLLYALLEALSIHTILRRFKRRPKFLSSLAYSTSDVY